MADPRFVELGKRVREAREQSGFTQAQVAKRMGLDRSAISLIEQGKREVNSFELGQLADILGFPMDYFFASEQDGEAEMYRVTAAFRADPELGEEALETLAWARSVLAEWVNLQSLIGGPVD